MQVSYSRIGAFKKCPFQYQLKYLEGLKVNRPVEPSDPLILGSAMHKGIEEGRDAGVAYYREKIPVFDDLCVHEEMKLRSLIPKVRTLLPDGCRYEVKLDAPGFVGFIDCLVPTGEPDEWDLIDFKYTNPKNADRYLESGQLEVYKHFFEQLGLGKIRDSYYLIVPKTAIRQKKTETLMEFRNRLRLTLDGLEPEMKKSTGGFPDNFFENTLVALTSEDFPKNETRLCDWCDFKDYCQSNGKDTTMILPSTDRRDVSKMETVKLWIYGEPFTGKTTFANQFPKPLMLNTDGNIKFVDAPFVALKDTIETEGRLTKTVHGWETLAEAVAELEKGSDFETVILDLVEGAYELNRSYIYEKRGWEHESDDSFRAWDIVRKNFYDLMRRLTNLPMNVVLISHEDTTRDFTARSGDKISSIKPNIPDKVAKVVAGMVDLVGRVIVHEGHHLLTFKTEEFVFGGGRLNLDCSEIPLDYSEFSGLLKLKCSPEDVPEEKPKTRRGRPKKTEEAPEASEAPEVEEVTPEIVAESEAEPVKRTRKRRTPVEE